MRGMFASRQVLSITAMAVALSVGGAAYAAPAQEQREERRTFSARSGASIDLENLAGRIRIEGKDGGDIEIVATINAADGSQADAETLFSLIDIQWDDDSDGDVNIEVDYPVERFDTYRYTGREGRFNTQTTYQGERVSVTSRDDNDAVTLFVDFVIRVPAGIDVDIENEVGDVSATNMNGDIRAETGSGNVSVSDVTGAVDGDTGSGNVEVERVTGEVVADTGSGNIELTDVTGDVVADTGSGNITLTNVDGSSISADTGSGDINLIQVTGDVIADTGSGNIVGRNITSGARISADTGSGDVRLEGDLSGARQIEIDTSSGDVELDMSAYPGMTFTIETGSGRIDVDLPDLDTVRSRRSYFSGRVGDGAADVVIDTGSGSVRIRGRERINRVLRRPSTPPRQSSGAFCRAPCGTREGSSAACYTAPRRRYRRNRARCS
jgi:DUF4097 and DUF4098 domain-containing protein YvlB